MVLPRLHSIRVEKSETVHEKSLDLDHERRGAQSLRLIATSGYHHKKLWQAKHDKSGMSFKSSIEFQ